MLGDCKYERVQWYHTISVIIAHFFIKLICPKLFNCHIGLSRGNAEVDQGNVEIDRGNAEIAQGNAEMQ